MISTPGWEGGVDANRRGCPARGAEPGGGPRVPGGGDLPVLLVGGLGPGQRHLLLLHHHDHHRVTFISGHNNIQLYVASLQVWRHGAR